MSGGFFRGTSAEQDTRFSNKQAKLLKSQKFAPELEHLVDTTKVKMDVMRPWIANRVTELIGFEDEVLINFIYGLLDGKVVNGKEVQISLTGFMERNTGKFMKELWVLLLSAQKNASGVPQQFLDAKEEESKKKKAESDRIANEIQRRKDKESRELEQEKYKMDAGNGVSKDFDPGAEPSTKIQPVDLVLRMEKEKQPEARNGSRGRRSSKSPLSADRSSSPRGRRSRSISKSVSNSRSYSNERSSWSRSLSASPKRRRRPSSRENRFSPKRSQSPKRRHSPRRSMTPPGRRSSRSLSASPERRRRPSSRKKRFSPKRSQSPQWRRSPRRSMTPLGRRSSYYRRSLSRSHHISPSPQYRRRSPYHRRSRSPLRRRSRSPLRPRSRSPMRRRSRSPMRGRPRSPMQRRSESPFRRSPSDSSSSPVQTQSPFVRRKSPFAVYRRSPSPPRRQHKGSSLTPWRRSPPNRQRTPEPRQRRSPSPANDTAPPSRNRGSPAHGRSTSPVVRPPSRKHRSPVDSSRETTRKYAKSSPVRDISPLARSDRAAGTLKGNMSSDCCQSDSLERNDSHAKSKALLPPPHKSLSNIEAERENSPIEATRSRGFPEGPKREKITGSFVPSPQNAPKDKKSTVGDLQKPSADYVGTDNRRKGDLRSHKSSTNPSNIHKGSHGQSQFENESSQKISSRPSDHASSSHHEVESNSKDRLLQSGNKVEKVDRLKKPGHGDSHVVGDALFTGEMRDSPIVDGSGKVKKNQYLPVDVEIKDCPLETLSKFSRKVERDEKTGSLGTGSEESNEKGEKVREKRKNKRPRELESDYESSFDSYENERKEAKRRRKEEKKLRKEERRRKRQERRRRREERRSKKKMIKSSASVSSPSDTERHNSDHSDDDQYVRRRESRDVDRKERESEQKKLEMQLREKALESLRAKKGIGH